MLTLPFVLQRADVSRQESQSSQPSISMSMYGNESLESIQVAEDTKETIKR